MKLDGKSSEYVRGYRDAVTGCEEAIREARLFFVTSREATALKCYDQFGEQVIKMVESVYDTLISGFELVRKKLGG